MKREDALDYHASGRPGKIAVVPTKPLNNQRDLALAYSPGVALPCLEIESNPEIPVGLLGTVAGRVFWLALRVIDPVM